MTDLLNLLTSFHGRISRKQWWLGFVIVCVGSVAGALLLNPDFFAPMGTMLYLVPHFGQTIGPQSIEILMILFWVFAAYFVLAFIDNGFVRGTDPLALNRYEPDPLTGA